MDKTRIVQLNITRSTELGGINVIFVEGYTEDDDEISFLDKIDINTVFESEKEVLKELKKNCPEYNFSRCDVEIL